MDGFALYVPAWLDAVLIAPFRLPSSAHAGLWLGSASLSCYCLLLGELTGAGLFFTHHKKYSTLYDTMIQHHNISVDALHSGNKEVYLAANELAREDFGKYFFNQAAKGLATLWPVPLALAWMSLRFEGIVLYTIPGTNLHAGYVFVLLILYIPMRIFFSRWKKHLPFFHRIEAVKKKKQLSRKTARSFLQPFLATSKKPPVKKEHI